MHEAIVDRRLPNDIAWEAARSELQSAVARHVTGVAPALEEVLDALLDEPTAVADAFRCIGRDAILCSALRYD